MGLADILATAYLVVLETLKYLRDRILDKLLGQPMIGKLQEKCVFITGCDSGFGNLLAKKLDSKGVPVIAACFTQQGAAQISEECSSRLQTVQLDVTNSKSIEDAVNFVEKNLPPKTVLWGVVNNAGVATTHGPAEFATREDFRFCFEVNAFGTAEVSIKFLPLLKKSKGRIVNISSVAGRVAFSTGYVYCSSKFAVEGISDTLRRDLKVWGIGVHVLEPWYYKTALVERNNLMDKIIKRWDTLPQSIKDDYGQEWFDQGNKEFGMALDYLSHPNLYEVVDTYIHALFAKYPRSRYPVGKFSLVCILEAMLPDFLSDIFHGHHGPPPKAVLEGKYA